MDRVSVTCVKEDSFLWWGTVPSPGYQGREKEGGRAGSPLESAVSAPEMTEV